MDRVTVTLGTEDGGTRIVDRSAFGLPGRTEDRAGDSSLGPAGIGPVLPRSAQCAQAGLTEARPHAEPEVVLHDVWSQLSVPDRQQFGHRFSFMVLKALGLRPCSTQEVQA
jgi:hypothetical protein